MSQVDVCIVGGGIAGLSAAWYLQQEAAERGREVSYCLLESGDRWGGKILTDRVAQNGGAPFVVEGGPDSFITQKPWALQLARELGMEDSLLPTNDSQRQVFVLNKRKPTPLPEGVMLIVPTKFTPFARSPLISPLGKLRMGMEMFVPAKQDDKDETLADFIRRRLGNEALDKIAEPLMSGIYNAESERQSLMATFPRFRALEQKHGSLIKGMLAARQQASKRPASASNSKRPPSIFVSFERGMCQFVEALRARLRGDCRLSTRVEGIEPAGPNYSVTLGDGETISAKSVILAIPSYTAASLVEGIAPDAAEGLNDIRYVSTGTISLAFKREEFGHPLNGFGIVIPRSENRQINAITWTSTKFAQRAPEDHVLLRVFFGGSRTPQMMDVDDDRLVATVLGELKSIMSVAADPLFHRIYRWNRSNPQYDLGHLERVASIEDGLPAGLFVTGSPYRGVGIPDCVHQAQQAAVKAITSLLKNDRTPG